jgi:hypothetical protein
MKLKLTIVVAACAFAAAPAFAQEKPPSHPTLSTAEIQKVIQIVSGDKTKTQQYCELGKINQQMAQAQEKRDNATLDRLGQQADELEEKIGPEFVKFIDALDQMEEQSSEGKELMAAVETLDKLCADK